MCQLWFVFAGSNHKPCSGLVLLRGCFSKYQAAAAAVAFDHEGLLTQFSPISVFSNNCYFSKLNALVLLTIILIGQAPHERISTCHI